MTLILTGLFSALTASLVASFAGGGSSLILLPLMLFFAPGNYVSLLTTTKVSATTMTLVSAGIHRYRNEVENKLLATLISLGLIGTAMGTYLVQYQPNESLYTLILSGTLLFTALYLSVSKGLGVKDRQPRELSRQTLFVVALFTLIINVLNGLFGGTGILMTIFCVVYLRLPFIKSIAYTMLMYVVINVLQTSYLLYTVPVNMPLTLSTVVGALVGAWMGTHLQYLKGNKWVKVAAIVMMFSVGIKLLLE